MKPKIKSNWIFLKLGAFQAWNQVFLKKTIFRFLTNTSKKHLQWWTTTTPKHSSSLAEQQIRNLGLSCNVKEHQHKRLYNKNTHCEGHQEKDASQIQHFFSLYLDFDTSFHCIVVVSIMMKRLLHQTDAHQ